MWLPYTPEQKSEFVALAELYSGAREAFRSVAAASRWQRTPGSRAAADWDAIVARRPALSPGSESLTTGLCHHYLYAAGEQLGALSALYAANEVLLSPNVIARCAVEHAAHIVWVLGAPGDGVDERLARTFLEELADAEHAKTTAGHLIGKAHPEYRQRLANWKELKADVTRAFPAPTTDHEGRPRILGQGLPRPAEVVVEMYGRLTPALPEKQRQGIYDLLSNHVHPTMYPTRELFRPVVTEDGHQGAELMIDNEYHRKLARLTIAPFHFAFAHVLAYHGWPGDQLKTLEANIERVVPGALVGSQTI